MRNNILFTIFFIGFMLQVNCQNELKETENEIIDKIAIAKNKNYIFTSGVSIEGYYYDKTKLKKSEDQGINSLVGQMFKVIKKDSNYVYFRYFDYNQEKDLEKQKEYVHSNGLSKIFRIGLNIFNQVTREIYPIYAGEKFGVVSIPFKIRLGNSDFETNANIGLNAAFMYRLNRKIKDRWILQPNIGIGLSDIPLNESNSDVDKAENRTALSFSAGLMLNISNDINLGIFLGVDRLNKTNQSVNWKYHDKGWLGIGINIGFSESNSKNGDPKNNFKKQ